MHARLSDCHAAYSVRPSHETTL